MHYVWMTCREGIISAPEVGDYPVHIECHCNEKNKTFTCFKK